MHFLKDTRFSEKKIREKSEKSSTLTFLFRKLLWSDRWSHVARFAGELLSYACVLRAKTQFSSMLSWQNNINISRSNCLSYANFLSVVDVYCFERKEENWKGLVRLLLCRIPDARFYHETFVLETVTFMAGTRHFPWLFPLLSIMFLLPQKNKTIGNINRALLYIQPVKLIELEQYFVNSCKYQTFCK